MNDIDATTKEARRRLVYLNQRIVEMKNELEEFKSEREEIKTALNMKSTAQ